MNPFNVGDITLCWHCGYACQLRRSHYHDDETGERVDYIYWDHFAFNDFTNHQARPKISIRETTIHPGGN